MRGLAPPARAGLLTEPAVMPLLGPVS
jgi:hypothetical protein